MPKFILALSFVSILVSCATTSRFDTRIDKRISPPLPNFLAKWKGASKSDLEKLQVGSNEDNIRWWKTYMLGTCEGYKSLAISIDFPLNDLALLRAYEICPAKETLPALPPSVSPWYRELVADIKLKESEETEDIRDDLDALTEKAKLESNKKKKEEYLLKALLLAQRLELKPEASSIQASLYKNSPRLNPLPAMSDLSNVAMDYRFHREFDQAVATYKKILSATKSSPEDKYQAQKSLRQTYKVAQQRNDYIAASADLVNFAKKQMQANKGDRRAIARYHDAQVLLAKTLWTEDQTSQAVKTLNETHKRLRGLYPMDEVFMILGRIDEERGNFEKAIEYYEASYTQPVSTVDLRDKITWFKSWNYFKLKNYPKAAESFEQMKEVVKDPTDKARARFWLARTYKALDQKDKAQEELAALIKEDPLGYYGVMAYRDLGRPFPALKVDPDKMLQLSLLSVGELDPSLRLTVEWLIAVNEKAFAEKAINSAVDDLKKRNITREDTWMAVSSAYARAGLYLPLFSTIGALDPAVKDQLLNDHPDLLFPRPFKDIVAGASEKSGIPQEFIYSIIRQESAFNPEARSPADAFGLMQLLPSVARQLAVQNKLPYSEALDLYKPEINVPLGAFELKSLMKKYDDKFILAVSGYNANASAIRGWLKTRYRPDAVEFIEEVPYEETRAYIKLTMRNFVFYQRLIHDKESVAFLEALLKF
ncbi:Soluble lytic murein transglycosylase precursor [compost metagenome]